jgi:hypothetical protein
MNEREDFPGRWHTTFGPMDLEQRGARVRGTYSFGEDECTLEGTVERGRLTFRFAEPDDHGEGWFELTREGQGFRGRWRPEEGDWGDWVGERWGFDGLWDSDFGLLRLVQQGEEVRGYYEVPPGSLIEGRLAGERLEFSYREPEARGEGWFELAEDGLSFRGKWRVEGEERQRSWRARRVQPAAGLTWLVVLESPWQIFLSEKEYSFGAMLREFFARFADVEVRHRFFDNEAALRACCRDVLYLAEPVVLVIAAHARPEGITLEGRPVDVRPVVAALREALDLRLLHFSACLVLQEPAQAEALGELSDRLRLPISGYATSVNWAASAIIEFTYLEMILADGLAPAEAAAQLPRLLTFAGDADVPDSPFRAAGFRIIVPRRGR